MSGQIAGKHSSIYANDPFTIMGIAFAAAMSLSATKPCPLLDDGKDRGMSPRGYGQYLRSHRGKKKKGGRGR